MSEEENKAVVRRWSEEVWSKGNMAAFDELAADDFTAHDPTAPGPRNKAEYRQWILDLRSAFPDLRFTTEGLYADGDYVVWRSRGEGTFHGPFMGVPPNNKHGQANSVDIIRVSGGQCHETWELWDAFNMFQQIGILPSTEDIFGAAASQRPPEGPTPGAPMPH